MIPKIGYRFSDKITPKKCLRSGISTRCGANRGPGRTHRLAVTYRRTPLGLPQAGFFSKIPRREFERPERSGSRVVVPQRLTENKNRGIEEAGQVAGLRIFDLATSGQVLATRTGRPRHWR